MMVRMCVDGPLQKRIDPGVWPAQFVFGRNPKIPEHLMHEPLEVVPATAPLYEEEVARHVAVRHAARRAVLELQDSKALRLALAAKPRHQKEPEPAQLVAYWRTQKWEQGQLNNHGRWHGPAIVLGKVGRNFVVVHKRQVIRCAPERIRAASRQYFDLIPQGYPTEERPEAVPVEAPAQSEDRAPAMSLSDRLNAEPARPAAMAGPGVDDSAAPDTTTANAEPTDDVDPSNNHHDVRNDLDKSPEESSTYGPVRRRLRGKNGPSGLYRPALMIADDFAEIMQEIVPKLVEQVFHKPMHPMQLCHHHDLIVSNVRLVQTVLNHMVTLRPHG